MDYQDYLQSESWRDKRAAVLQRAKGCCERCGWAADEVHHKTYVNVPNEPLSDLLALCRGCHKLEHGRLQGAAYDRQIKRQVQYQDRVLRDLYAPTRR
jgi:5-methylcytosine-specific restriction endonuclease McrA